MAGRGRERTDRSPGGRSVRRGRQSLAQRLKARDGRAAGRTCRWSPEGRLEPLPGVELREVQEPLLGELRQQQDDEDHQEREGAARDEPREPPPADRDVEVEVLEQVGKDEQQGSDRRTPRTGSRPRGATRTARRRSGGAPSRASASRPRTARCPGTRCPGPCRAPGRPGRSPAARRATRPARRRGRRRTHRAGGTRSPTQRVPQDGQRDEDPERETIRIATADLRVPRPPVNGAGPPPRPPPRAGRVTIHP